MIKLFKLLSKKNGGVSPFKTTKVPTGRSKALVKANPNHTPHPDDEDIFEIVAHSWIGDAYHTPEVLDACRDGRYLMPVGMLQHSSSTMVASQPLPIAQLQAPYLSSSRQSSTSTLVDVCPARPLFTDDFKFVGFINRGSFGRVFRVQCRKTKRVLAVKVVPHHDLSEAKMKEVLKEQKIQKAANQADAPCVMKLEGSWSDEEFLYTLMVQYPTDLDEEFQRFGNKFSPVQARFYFVEIIMGLDTLHRLGVIHRDVKLANVLLTQDGHAVLSDFGLSKHFARRPTEYERTILPYWLDTSKPESRVFVSIAATGTPNTMSPEIIRGELYSFEADIWAAVVLLYLMRTGEQPFHGHLEDESLWRAIEFQEVSFKPEFDLTEDEMSFIRVMLAKRRQDRLPLGGQMEQHPYLRDITEWERYRQHQMPLTWKHKVPKLRGARRKSIGFESGEPHKIGEPSPLDFFDYTRDPVMDEETKIDSAFLKFVKMFL